MTSAKSSSCLRWEAINLTADTASLVSADSRTASSASSSSSSTTASSCGLLCDPAVWTLMSSHRVDSYVTTSCGLLCHHIVWTLMSLDSYVITSCGLLCDHEDRSSRMPRAWITRLIHCHAEISLSNDTTKTTYTNRNAYTKVLKLS